MRRYASRTMIRSKHLTPFAPLLLLSTALLACDPGGGTKTSPSASPAAPTTSAASTSPVASTTSGAGPAASAAQAPAQPVPATVASMVELFALVSEGKSSEALWAEDAELSFVDSLEDPKKGRPAILGYLDATKKAYPDFQIVPVRAWALSEREVLLEGVFRGKNEGPFADGSPATGKTVGGTMAQFATFEDDGKLGAVEVYVNELSTVVQLGFIPPMGTFPPNVPLLPTRPYVVMSGAGDDSALGLMKKVDAALYEARDINLLDKLYAQDVKVGFPVEPQRSSLEARQNEARPFITANSGDTVEYEKTWNVGGYTILLCKHSAKHVGKVGPYEATNKTFTRRYFQIARAEGGKLVEFTYHGNSLGPMMQLGLFPELESKIAAAKK